MTSAGLYRTPALLSDGAATGVRQNVLKGHLDVGDVVLVPHDLHLYSSDPATSDSLAGSWLLSAELVQIFSASP